MVLHGVMLFAPEPTFMTSRRPPGCATRETPAHMQKVQGFRVPFHEDIPRPIVGWGVNPVSLILVSEYLQLGVLSNDMVAWQICTTLTSSPCFGFSLKHLKHQVSINQHSEFLRLLIKRRRCCIRQAALWGVWSSASANLEPLFSRWTGALILEILFWIWILRKISLCLDS